MLDGQKCAIESCTHRICQRMKERESCKYALQMCLDREPLCTLCVCALIPRVYQAVLTWSFNRECNVSVQSDSGVHSAVRRCLTVELQGKNISAESHIINAIYCIYILFGIYWWSGHSTSERFIIVPPKSLGNPHKTLSLSKLQTMVESALSVRNSKIFIVQNLYYCVEIEKSQQLYHQQPHYQRSLLVGAQIRNAIRRCARPALLDASRY